MRFSLNCLGDTSISNRVKYSAYCHVVGLFSLSKQPPPVTTLGSSLPNPGALQDPEEERGFEAALPCTWCRSWMSAFTFESVPFSGKLSTSQNCFEFGIVGYCVNS